METRETCLQFVLFRRTSQFERNGPVRKFGEDFPLFDVDDLLIGINIFGEPTNRTEYFLDEMRSAEYIRKQIKQIP